MKKWFFAISIVLLASLSACDARLWEVQRVNPEGGLAQDQSYSPATAQPQQFQLPQAQPQVDSTATTLNSTIQAYPVAAPTPNSPSEVNLGGLSAEPISGGYIDPSEWDDIGQNRGMYFQNRETGMIVLTTGGAPGVLPPSQDAFQFCIQPNEALVVNMAPYEPEITVVVHAEIDEFGVPDLWVAPNKNQFPDAVICRAGTSDIGQWGMPAGSVEEAGVLINNPPHGNSGKRYLVEGVGYLHFIELYYNVCFYKVGMGSTTGLCSPPPYCFDVAVNPQR